MPISTRLNVSGLLRSSASWWPTPSGPSRPRVIRMRKRRRSWTRRAAAKPLRLRTPPNEGRALKIRAHSLVVTQDRCSSALTFCFPTSEQRWYEFACSAGFAGVFVMVPGPLAALAQAPDDARLWNAGRPTQEHASVDNPLVILLVEDEVLVRMVAADVLSEAGF